MRLLVVMLVVLGGGSLCGFGQGDGWVGELRLELAWPEEADNMRGRAHFVGSFKPTVIMRLTADGSVRSRYVIQAGWTRPQVLEEDEVDALLSDLGQFRDQKRTGDGDDPADQFGEFKGNAELVAVRRVLGRLDRDMARHMIVVTHGARKRAKAFIGADIDLRRDAIRKLEGRVIEGWTMTLDLGLVDLPELGGRQWVWWQGWQTAGSEPDDGLLLEVQDGTVPGARSMGMSPAFFEQLGRVPDALARGKSVRWEEEGQMLRAFVENKAIFYRPDTGKAEDVRISLETAQEAWKVLEKRDRAEAWFRKTVAPGLGDLMKQGRE